MRKLKKMIRKIIRFLQYLSNQKINERKLENFSKLQNELYRLERACMYKELDIEDLKKQATIYGEEIIKLKEANEAVITAVQVTLTPYMQNKIDETAQRIFERKEQINLLKRCYVKEGLKK